MLRAWLVYHWPWLQGPSKRSRGNRLPPPCGPICRQTYLPQRCDQSARQALSAGSCTVAHWAQPHPVGLVPRTMALIQVELLAGDRGLEQDSIRYQARSVSKRYYTPSSTVFLGVSARDSILLKTPGGGESVCLLPQRPCGTVLPLQWTCVLGPHSPKWHDALCTACTAVTISDAPCALATWQCCTEHLAELHRTAVPAKLTVSWQPTAVQPVRTNCSQLSTQAV